MDTRHFQNPSDAEITAFLGGVRRIAVVGLSPKTDRPSHRIAKQLQRRGYRIIPVRPAVDQLLGETAYASLAEVPGPVDLVDVFRAAAHIPALAEECIRLKLPGLWIQSGILAPEAAQRARDAGLFVVMDACLGATVRRLGLKAPKP